MKAKWLHEVKEILGQESFRAWFDELERARLALREATERYEELLTQVNLKEFRAELAQKNAIDTLYRASEYEDAAAQMLAEATDLENKSLENLGNFEEQRMRTSELWFKLEAAEHDLENEKKKNNPLRVKELERELARTKEEYERESSKKQRLWEEVEAMWGISVEKNLFLFEKRMKGKLVRRQAERLFAVAEESQAGAEALKADSEAMARERDRLEDRVGDLIAQAREDAGAIIHEDFLYWQMKEDNKASYVAPLFSDLNSYNIELKACHLYRCDRSRGVEFLEPVIEARKVELEDKRLEEFFLNRPRREPGSSRQTAE